MFIWEIRKILIKHGLQLCPHVVDAMSHFAGYCETAGVDKRRTWEIIECTSALVALHAPPSVPGATVLAEFQQALLQVLGLHSVRRTAIEHALQSYGMRQTVQLIRWVRPPETVAPKRWRQHIQNGARLAAQALAKAGRYYWGGGTDFIESAPYGIARTTERPLNLELAESFGGVVLNRLQARELIKMGWRHVGTRGEDLLVMTEDDFQKYVFAAKQRGLVLLSNEDDTFREGHSNDFGPWLDKTGRKIGRQARINCWQAVFLMAFKAGLITKTALRDAHTLAISAGEVLGDDHYFRDLLSLAGYRFARPLPPDVHPYAGDILFFKGYAHVAIATGDQRKMMSLYMDDASHFAHIDIDDFAQRWDLRTISYTACPW